MIDKKEGRGSALFHGGEPDNNSVRGGQPDQSGRVALSDVGGHEIKRLDYHGGVEVAKHVVDDLLKQTG